jgi:hypothetical protein
MSGARSALIVATYQYDDPRLSMLRAPERDAEALGEVLGDAAIGGFDVRTVVNQPAHVISVEVAEFFAHRHVGDVLLVHFSCHGVKDDSGELFLAATDTRMDLLEATAVSSGYVNRAMTRSRSGCVVLLLDCCYAGAFARGMTRAGSDVDVTDRFGGRGRAVITASTALQFAFEGSELSTGDLAEPGPSVFTRALVDGLRSGDADRNSDGIVSLDELYAHVHDEVTRANPDQTPQKWLFDVAGDLYVARRATPVTRPSELPGPLVESIDSLLTWERESTVDPLQILLLGAHPGRALAARLALERLATNDDSFKVRQAARAALDSAPAPATPLITPGDRPTGPDAGEPAAVEPTEPPPGVRSRIDDPVVAAPVVGSRVLPAPPTGRRWRDRRAAAVVAACASVLLLVGAGLLVRHWVGHGTAGNAGDNGGASALGDQIVVMTSSGAHLTTYDATTWSPVGSVPTTQQASRPSISPDRTSLTYLVAVDGNPNAPSTPRIVASDGSADRPLLSGSALAKCPVSQRPTWSPDGTQFALICLNAKGDSLGLYLLSRDGSTLRPLVKGADVCCGVTWTAQDELVFGRETFDNPNQPPTGSHLWIVTTHGTQAQQVTKASGVWDSNPDYTDADGGRLVFLRSPGFREPGNVFVLTAKGSQVTTSRWSMDGDALSPTWSTDGSTVAFVRHAADQDALWTMTSPTGAQATGITGSTLGPPAWGTR